MLKNSNPFIVSLCLLSFIAPQVTFAAVQMNASRTLVAKPTSSCTQFANNLGTGSTDKTTQGEVTKLQNFLVANNYLSDANLVTTKASKTKDKKGSFGPITAEAVGKFQLANNITVKGGTGYKRVGPTTGKKIKELACGTSTKSPLKVVNTTPDIGSLLRSGGSASASASVAGGNVNSVANGNANSVNASTDGQVQPSPKVDVGAVFRAKAKI